MYDFHPLLTSFPIVLITLAILSDILFFYTKKPIWLQFNSYVLILGFLFSILAFLSGLIASSNASQTSSTLPENLIATHYSFAKLILFAYIPLLLFRYLRLEKELYSYIYFICCFIQFALIAYTSNLGGDLVYKHGVGVNIEGTKNNLR